MAVGRPTILFFFLFWIYLGQILFVLAQGSRKRLDECVSKNIKDSRHHRRFRIFEAPAKWRLRAETILRLIANYSRQSADNSLPDKIDRIISVVCRVENCHVIDIGYIVAILVD